MGVSVLGPDATTYTTLGTDGGKTTIDESGWVIADLWSTPLKIFVAAKGGLTVDSTVEGVTLTATSTDELYVGTRSLHEQPARTITTPAEPESLMRAISEFGGALKTASCQRSYPTLRGHPPMLELGDELTIPGESRVPDTDIEIVAPPSLRAIFTVAPLAYYLGAPITPGEAPHLRSSDGWEQSLTDRGGLTPTVNDVLQHVFTLDCIVRTEGQHPPGLSERAELMGSLPAESTFDPAAAYDTSLATRLATYLEVPFEPVKTIAPQWRHTADIPAGTAGVEVLPFLAADLTRIRCYTPGTKPEATSSEPSQTTQTGTTTECIGDIEEFLRTQTQSPPNQTDTSPTTLRGAEAGTPTHKQKKRQQDPDVSRATRAGEPVDQQQLFKIRGAPTPVHSYVGDGFPVGANKATRASYEQQLASRTDAKASAEILIVCNDEKMAEETAVREQYGTFELLPMDVSVRYDLSRDELQEALQRDVDLFHYIGHVDSRGLQANTQYLDVQDVEEVGATAFILNGCRSFAEGSKLVERGAVGGVVTLRRVHNTLATEMGRNIAQLVNEGWPLDQAVSLLETDALVARDYAVVGDGSVELVANAATPSSLIVTPSGDDQFEVAFHTHPTKSYNLGTLYQPPIDNAPYHLSGGESGRITLSGDELEAVFQQTQHPVQLRSEREKTTISLRWSSELIGNVDKLNEATSSDGISSHEWDDLDGALDP